MTVSQFGTRFTIGASFLPDGTPGAVLRDYETDSECPFYLVDTTENLVYCLMAAAMMIQHEAVPILVDPVDIELGIMIQDHSVFYGCALGTLPLVDDEERAFELPDPEEIAA